MATKLEMTVTVLVLIAIIVSASSLYYITSVIGPLTETMTDVTSRLAHIEELLGELSPPPEIKEDFIIAFQSDAAGIEICYTHSGDHMALASQFNMYDTLLNCKIEKDPETGAWVTTVTSEGVAEYVPGLIESWEHNEDYTTWTLHVRKNAKFHSGNEVNATSLRWAIVNYDLDSWCAWYWGMAGYEPLFDFEHVKDSIEVVDEYTLRFHLDFPNTNFLSYLTGTGALMVDWSYILSQGGVNKMAPTEWFSKSEAGSGPFKLVSWERGKEMVFERFEDYWGPKPEIKRLVFKVIPEMETAMMMLEKGEIDAIFSVPPEHVEYLDAKPNIKVIGYPSMENVLISFNLNETLDGKDNPLSDRKVREALQYTFPQKNFIKEILYGRAITSRSCLPVGYEAYTGEYWDPEERFDLDKAKELLSESGYPDGFETEIIIGEGRVPNNKDIAVVWQEQLAQIGVTLNIRVLPMPQFTTLTINRNAAPIYLTAGTAYVQDPLYSDFWWFHPDGTVNYANLNDTDWVNLFNEAMIEEDLDQRTELSHQMQRILIDRGYILPLFVRYRDCAMNINTKDYFFHWNLVFLAYHAGIGPHVEIPTE